MTVITYDGEVLASDSRQTEGNVCYEVEKIWRLKDGRLYGGCGTGNIAELVRDWFNEGCPEEWRPDIVLNGTGDNADEFGGLVIDAAGAVYAIDRHLALSKLRSLPIAIGSSAQAAMMLMKLGYAADKAVELIVQHQIDPNVGGAVQRLARSPAQPSKVTPCRPRG